ncbi:hypothetical protein DRP07_00715 [Archaeoglobales archaeon]|nr:MAG: hypothetical protein DRP07_00715 [Archaeoglobales archaeon]
MFMRVYIFSLCITLGIGVAAYTTVFPSFMVQSQDINQMYNQTMNEVKYFLTGNIDNFADGFFASAFIIYSSLKIALMLLVNAPVIVEQTVNYFGLPSALTYPIVFMSMIAFIGTVYNIVRGLRALRW